MPNPLRSFHVPTHFEKLAAEKATVRVRHVKTVTVKITVISPLTVQTSDETVASVDLLKSLFFSSNHFE